MDCLFATGGPGDDRPGAPEGFRLDHLSRREFLKQSQRGLLSLFMLPLLERVVGKERLMPEDPPARIPAGVVGMTEEVPKMGRVLDNSLAVYKEPNPNSTLLKMYWRDLVFPISAVAIGDPKPTHNRVWYRLNDEGYAHSGKIQPVAIQQNQPAESLPEKGALAEVTVPFTDALADPNRPDFFVYRLYYSTVHWVDRIKIDKNGQPWYHIRDDKFRQKEYYVNARHLRVIPPEDLAPLSPEVPVTEKRIEVRLNDQVVLAYEAEKLVFMTRVASGAVFIDGNYTTPSGRFLTNRKRPSRHMASGDLAAPNSYDLPGVPWVTYLTLSGISFHGTYWHNDFGRPRSHGCLNLTSNAARWIYRWTMPSVPSGERLLEGREGTRVDIIE